ncbi:hypothetical protein R3W88_022652 [Solanum pinnatisectum]|uniref:Uncharacterized protein n=1 Tax=Solanum pinnatisectum TaxID=50273 RepID=A0AAV9LYK9_9SOLN|nr:hypothetical protein R3W88_022652 [Solanum pinnatisectum]
MTCSSCGIPKHNARSCHKMDKQCDEGKKQMKERHRTLIDEEDVESSPSRSPNAAIVEDFPLKAPPPNCASDEDFDLEVKNDMTWKPRGISVLKSRIQQRQKQAQPIGSRQINFLGDGLTASSDLYAPKWLTWKGNASIIETMLEQL